MGRIAWRICAGALVVVAAALVLWWQSRPDGRLRLIFPATSGDVLIMITPGGRVVLIDGGADPSALPQILGRLMPVWERDIDAIVLTKADRSRLPGLLATARRYSIGTALLPAQPKTEEEQALRRLLMEHGTAVRVAPAGATMEIDGVRLAVVAAGGGRLALRLQYRSFAGLLAPAAREDDTALLAEQPAQLLFYPWDAAGDRELAEHIGARVVVYGEERDPSGSGQRRTYFERGSGKRRLLHERIDGDIELISDGARIWVETGAKE